MVQKAVYKTATVTETVSWKKCPVSCITLALGPKKHPSPLLTSGFLPYNALSGMVAQLSHKCEDLSLVPQAKESKRWPLWYIHTHNSSAEEAEP